jgi:hypothetical protein
MTAEHGAKHLGYKSTTAFDQVAAREGVLKSTISWHAPFFAASLLVFPASGMTPVRRSVDARVSERDLLEFVTLEDHFRGHFYRLLRGIPFI